MMNRYFAQYCISFEFPRYVLTNILPTIFVLFLETLKPFIHFRRRKDDDKRKLLETNYKNQQFILKTKPPIFLGFQGK